MSAPDDIAGWLDRIGLAAYAPVFAEHAIDREVLADLNDRDLKELGLPLGHRKKLLKAIVALNADASAPRTRARPIAAERRQPTVMFADLVGSTALAARLDPEDMAGVIRAYQDCCARVVERWGGHVAKYMGGGVLAYFGWPQAHEDEAERAVRAGLELVAAVAALETPAREPLAARVGIATGLVMVGELIGEGAAREEAVVGETPNLAARLQALAAPGGVVISPATRRLLGCLFDLDDLGRQHLKGFAEPLAAWRVAGEGRAEGRFEARQTAGLTPLVGRDEEIALLLRRWQQAKDGEGHVVLLSGEPGIGKSRLVREVRARLKDEPHVRLLYQCSPHHTTSPLHPLIEQLERAAGFAADDRAEAKLDKLAALLARGTDRPEQAVPLIAALLGLPTDGRYPALDLTPQRQKQLTLAALVEQLEGLAAAQPVLLAYEDVHWSDPTTQQLLGLTIERLQRLPVLLLITYRPEFGPPWPAQPHVSALALARLGRREGAALVERVVKDKPLPDEVAAQIVAKTDGVPLFVEELTKTVLESGLLKDAGDHYELSGPLPPLAIPSTLHDSLLARLDRLTLVKEVAQIGAALGREFSHALLTAVADRPEAELQAALDRLVAAELVYRRGTAPDVTYSFKHALVQDAAYGTLLKSRRQQLHARIAKVLEDEFLKTAETQPEILAHHFAQAAMTEKATAYRYQAGQLAIRRSAMVEATAHFTDGLRLLETLADTPQRRHQELALQTGLGSASIASKGFAAPETGLAFARARDLCRQLGDDASLGPVLYGRFVYHLVRAELEAARAVAAELTEHGKAKRDTGAELVGQRCLGFADFGRGEFVAGRVEFERALALHEPQAHSAIARIYSVDLVATTRSWLSIVLLARGYPESSQHRSREALSATAHGHLHTRAITLSAAAALAALRGDLRRSRAYAETALELAGEEDYPYWRAMAMMLHGWALACEGDSAAGLAELAQGLASWHTTGSSFFMAWYQGMLADIHARAARTEVALAALADARKHVSCTGERWYEAELYRAEGDLLASSGERAAASAAFSRASGLRASRALGCGNYAPRPASPDFGPSRTSGRRPTTSSRRSTAGSPRASTPPT